MKYTKHIITGELLFIFVMLCFIAFSQSTGFISITGFQVANITSQGSIRQELETGLPGFDFLQETDDVTMCIIVRMNPLVSYSYDVVKLGDAVVVSNAGTELCKGIEQEDFIISYISYEKLKEHLDTKPSLTELKSVGDGTSFYLYPSRQILSGTKIAKPDEFNQKFGTVLNKYFTSDEIKLFKTVSGESRTPSPAVLNVLYLVAGALVLVVVISLVVLSHTKKPSVMEDLELVSYIKAMVAQGYQEVQIRQTLAENGWKQENIEQAFKVAKSEVTMPQGYV